MHYVIDKQDLQESKNSPSIRAASFVHDTPTDPGLGGTDLMFVHISNSPIPFQSVFTQSQLFPHRPSRVPNCRLTRLLLVILIRF